MSESSKERATFFWNISRINLGYCVDDSLYLYLQSRIDSFDDQSITVECQLFLSLILIHCGNGKNI